MNKLLPTPFFIGIFCLIFWACSKDDVVKSTSQALQIGQNYQGGKIGYIFRSGDLGYVNGQTNGIIVAEIDQTTTAQPVSWSSYATLNTGGKMWITGPTTTNSGIGAAKENTELIVNSITNPSLPANITISSQTAFAAKICSDLVLNGYSDWYLPTIDELERMYSTRSKLGGFKGADYWSSTAKDGYTSWAQRMDNDNIIRESAEDYQKSYTKHVRAIRYF